MFLLPGKWVNEGWDLELEVLVGKALLELQSRSEQYTIGSHEDDEREERVEEDVPVFWSTRMREEEEKERMTYTWESPSGPQQNGGRFNFTMQIAY